MRLLLVEDDPALGPELRNALSREGYAVDLVTDGVHAGQMGETEPYDLVVLDLGLPRRSGLELLKSWRARGIHVPVVILTARGSWQEKVEGFKAGADDYVGKPFRFEELTARLAAVLRRAQGAASGTALQAAGVTLDEASQALVRSDGSREALTGTEFRLLRYLMLHPGQVLSKEQLTEHAYEFDGARDSNVIEVYVNRLRQKVGRGKIVTRRGQGYVFAPKD
jgi:DNA-binding response OmpR family regulator